MSTLRLIGLAGAALAALFMVACTTVPETGRKQLNFLPDSFLASAAAAQFDALQQEIGRTRDAGLQARVERIGREIVAAARLQSPEANLPLPEDWDFVVFASDDINAFAMPGGKVGFYEGILRMFDNDDQLAAVMGHEVAHVAAQHGSERASQQLGVQLALLGGSIGLSHTEMSPENQQRLMAALGLGATLGIILPYSRSHESEADYLGIIYMARAGYDPYEAVTFWQKMHALSGGGQPEWLSTHPSSETRIRRLQQQIPDAKQRVHQHPHPHP